MTKRPIAMMKPETNDALMKSLRGPSGDGVAFITRVNFSAMDSLASLGVIGIASCRPFEFLSTLAPLGPAAGVSKR
jgi:hypothetical protein